MGFYDYPAPHSCTPRINIASSAMVIDQVTSSSSHTTTLRQDQNNTRCKQLHSTESRTLINNFSKKSASISSLSRVQPSILHQYHLISTTQSQLMLLKQTLFSRNQLNKCYPNKLLPLEISQCYRHMQIHCGRYNLSESNVHE